MLILGIINFKNPQKLEIPGGLLPPPLATPTPTPAGYGPGMYGDGSVQARPALCRPTGERRGQDAAGHLKGCFVNIFIIYFFIFFAK